jgi:serine/threonine-protein kinase RsbW
MERVVLSFPAHKKHLALAGAVIQELCGAIPQAGPSFSYNMQLAVDEAVVNVITHAYRDDPSGVVEMTCELHRDRLVVHIRDWGLSFDASAVPEPDLAEPQERGYGVYLIRNLMDSVQYQAGTPDGNCVTLTKRFK